MNRTTAKHPSRTRRSLIKTALIGGASGTVLGGLAHVARATAAGGVTLRLGYIGPARAPVSPTGYALARGHLQRELAPLGFQNVTTHGFPNGPDLNEAFFSGALDVGIYGDTPAVVARAQGLRGRLIGFEEIGMNCWLLTPRDGVRGIRQLDGKTVAVALGSYVHRYLLGTLDAAGLTGRTRIVYLLGGDAEATLQHASVSAYAAPIDVGPTLASHGYPVIDQAINHPGLLGSSPIVAATDTLDRAPQLPAAWNRARRAAIADIQRDSDAYYAFHKAQTGFSLEAIQVSHPVSNFPVEAIPANGLRLLESVKRFLLDAHLIRSDFPLAQWPARG